MPTRVIRRLHVSRHALVQKVSAAEKLNGQFIRRSSSSSSSSSSPSLLAVRSVPAPHSGSIRILGLNSPGSRNAISRALLAELRGQIESIHDEGPRGPTRAVVLASELDTAFCAGADLKERATFSREETQSFLTSLRSTFNSIAALPVPSIAAVAAPALGGGLELALTTHLRVFASTAVVGTPETRLAIIPGAGGTYRLPRLVGRSRALDLMLTGRRVGGAEAYFLGLCDRLVDVAPETKPEDSSSSGGSTPSKGGSPREMTLAAALDLARNICEGGPLALRAVIKAAVGGLGGGQDAENAAYEEVLDSKDRDEALLAFREKRKPVFDGT